MNQDLRKVYNILNERNQTLVVSEYVSSKYRKYFVDFDIIDKAPLLGYYSFSKNDIENMDLDDETLTSISEYLAKLGFEYSDSTISVGISRRSENEYVVSIFDSYTNTYLTSDINCDSSVDINNIISYIANEILYKSNAIEIYKKGIVKRVK